MKLKLPQNKSLTKAMRMRLFSIDEERIAHISDQTMHPAVAVTRLAVNVGLPLIAKQLGVEIEDNGDTPKKAA
jgi:hypothetical protein